MQGIQIVKEMAQQELSSQKAAYESKIKVLEAELVGGRAVFLPRQGVPGKLRILAGPGASRGNAAFGEEEIPRGSIPSSGLGSPVCWTSAFLHRPGASAREGGRVVCSFQSVSQPR